MILCQYLEIKERKIEELELAGKPPEYDKRIAELIRQTEEAIRHLYPLGSKEPLEHHRNKPWLIGMTAQTLAEKLRKIKIPKAVSDMPRLNPQQ